MAEITILLIIGMLTTTMAASVPTSNLDNMASVSPVTSGLQLGVESRYPVGDPRRCYLINAQDGISNDFQKFEVLPGFGWDNLRNVDQGQVVSYNYSQCLTTSDGRFLLPDSISVVPIKASRVQTSAELITKWTDFQSSSSSSINGDASLSFGLEGLFGFGISGKYSNDYQEVKSKQIGDKSYTAHTMLRYPRYEALLQPYAPLHPAFKKRVLDIAAAHELKERKIARYLSHLLVRDYGTHVVTSVEAGALLEQVDQVSQAFVDSRSDKKSSVTKAVSASFFAVFDLGDFIGKLSGGFSSGSSSSSDQQMAKDYADSRTSSRIITRGGPAFMLTNFSLNAWASDIDSNLVAIDRSGDPLNFFITSSTLPELPTSTLNEVHHSVQQAVATYYSHNVIQGCTDRDAPNFSVIANVDDGSCKKAADNLTFGGMYKTCQLQPGSNDIDLCKDHRQPNPLTGELSCPANYQAVHLHQGNATHSHTEHVCHDYFFFSLCKDHYYYSLAISDTYWCVATGPVPENTGMLFGGLFTSQVENPLTNSKACPSNFIPLRVGVESDLQVCVSSDYELGQKFALPFGGFFSCIASNPLAGNTHQCPEGYSQHMAAVDEGCQISYCIPTHSLNQPPFTPVKRPPFLPAPPLPAPPKGNIVLFDPETQMWKRDKAVAASMLSGPLADRLSSATSVTKMMGEIMGLDTASVTWTQSSNPAQAKMFGELFGLDSAAFNWQQGTGANTTRSGLSAGAVSGIAVGATFGCIFLATVAVLAMRARRRRRRSDGGQYRAIGSDADFPTAQQHYGTMINPTAGPASAGQGAANRPL